MEKSKKKLQEFAVPHPPISKLFSCKPAVKNIDVGGKGGVQKRKFSSQMIVLPQFMARIVDHYTWVFTSRNFRPALEITFSLSK